jgi:gluconolactonase
LPDCEWPSPNGLALNPEETLLFVAMTRGNAVWRLPLLPDGTTSKVGIFAQLAGGLSALMV